jgi:Ca2+:H+ antiporter
MVKTSAAAWTVIVPVASLLLLVSVVLGLPLVLGLEAKDLVLLLLAFLVSTITLASGRTNLMQGAVHRVIFAVFLFLTLVP